MVWSRVTTRDFHSALTPSPRKRPVTCARRTNSWLIGEPATRRASSTTTTSATATTPSPPATRRGGGGGGGAGPQRGPGEHRLGLGGGTQEIRLPLLVEREQDVV